MKPTPQERLHHAESQIDWYNREIKLHDQSASSFRKQREKYKGQRDRALAAIERENAAMKYRATKEK